MKDDKLKYYNSLKGKIVRLSKLSGPEYYLRYYGSIKEVYDDCLIIFDYKLQKEILLSFDNLSVLNIEDKKEDEINE